MATARTAGEQAAQKAAQDNDLKDGPDPAPQGSEYIVAFPLGLNVSVPVEGDGGKPTRNDDGTTKFERVHVGHMDPIPDGVARSEIDTLLALNYLVAKR